METFRTPDDITQALGFLSAHPQLSQKYNWWQEESERLTRESLDGLFPDVRRRLSLKLFRARPQYQPGAIVCGPVSADKDLTAYLRSVSRKMLCVETESGGVFRAARDSADTPALVIRGISDHADERKGQLEESSSGFFRLLAIRNASLFLKAQLANPFFVAKITVDRTEATAVIPAPDKADPIFASLDQINQQIDQNLRILSPEYKAHPRGYRLPVPRVMDAFASREKFAAYEPEDLVAKGRLLHIAIPANYPDKSIPWVYAHYLSTARVEDNPVVPIVVDAVDIRPPNKTLALAVDPIDLDQLAITERIQVVVIVINLPFGSRSRMKFLFHQLSKYVGVKFILISGQVEATAFPIELLTNVELRQFVLLEVSFSSIANFVRDNFQLETAEAEVIAYRLNETFKQFELPAHPSYFAGIPRETIAALLQAHRRAELIDLAVTGYLTFVVSEDNAKI